MRYFLTLLVLFSLDARADLQIFPTRLVLTDSKKITNISLRHFGEKPGQYKVTAVFYRMKSDGTMAIVNDFKDDEKPLVKYLRFSPRTVTIPPGAEQVVRVVYGGPGNLPEGEYRAHLHFEPTDAMEGEVMNLPSEDKRIKMQLQARIAFAVPIIFKHGKPQYSAKLSNLKVAAPAPETKEPTISLDVEWTGNSFPYGDFVAFLKTEKGESEVGVVRGVASYVSPRTVTFPALPDKKITNGTLRVEFREPEDSGAAVVQKIEAPVP